MPDQHHEAAVPPSHPSVEDPLAGYDPGSVEGLLTESVAPSDVHDLADLDSLPELAAGGPQGRVGGSHAGSRVSSDTPQVSTIEREAEAGILAAVLANPELFDDLVERLVPEDFAVPAHAAIYAAALACDGSGKALTAVTLADEMLRAGLLHRVDGEAVLAGLTSGGHDIAAWDAYVHIVLDRSLRRRMVAASRTIGAASLDPRQEARAALGAAEHAVFELGQDRVSTGPAPMSFVMRSLEQEMERARHCDLLGYSTGLPELDNLTGGLRAGQLIILAARPAMGKSVLATQIAKTIAQNEEVVVPVLTFEMTQAEVGFRLLAAESRVKLQSLQRGIIPAGRDKDVARAHKTLSSLQLLIDDRPPQTISAVRSAMRRLRRRGPLGAVVVDYLQLMSGDGGRRDENRQQEISNISRGLKLMADELEIPVIAVSQLSRGPELRPNKRPMLSDLRESGSLEQDASLVGMLFRPSVYDPQADPSHAELIIAKHRGGRTGTIALDWIGEQQRFEHTDRVVDAAADLAPAGGGGRGFGGGGGGFNGGGGGFGGGGFGGGGFL